MCTHTGTTHTVGASAVPITHTHNMAAGSKRKLPTPTADDAARESKTPRSAPLHVEAFLDTDSHELFVRARGPRGVLDLITGLYVEMWTWNDAATREHLLHGSHSTAVQTCKLQLSGLEPGHSVQDYMCSQLGIVFRKELPRCALLQASLIISNANVHLRPTAHTHAVVVPRNMTPMVLFPVQLAAQPLLWREGVPSWLAPLMPQPLVELVLAYLQPSDGWRTAAVHK